jgi:hypothetical protein
MHDGYDRRSAYHPQEVIIKKGNRTMNQTIQEQAVQAIVRCASHAANDAAAAAIAEAIKSGASKLAITIEIAAGSDVLIETKWKVKGVTKGESDSLPAVTVDDQPELPEVSK